MERIITFKAKLCSVPVWVYGMPVVESEKELVGENSGNMRFLIAGANPDTLPSSYKVDADGCVLVQGKSVGQCTNFRIPGTDEYVYEHDKVKIGLHEYEVLFEPRYGHFILFDGRKEKYTLEFAYRFEREIEYLGSAYDNPVDNKEWE